MALDHRRQRGDLAGLDRFFDRVFVLRCQPGNLQQNLRIAGRNDGGS
jgi:broad-specificity NMP kinase